MRAVLFDLDGTLVQSEKLKARSYAIAAQRLLGLAAPDERAIEAYRGIVGSARDVASAHVMREVGLEAPLRSLMAEYGQESPEAVLSKMRMDIYNAMVEDPEVIRQNAWPHTTGLLRTAKETFCSTGLATMSQRKEVEHVVRSLDIERYLDVITTREDVERPKPDPEIYLLTAQKLDVPPDECLVLEDSVMGVRAGVAAGMSVIAVATPFTECSLARELPVPAEWIVWDSDSLIDVVRRRIEEHNVTAHPDGAPS
ncbi:MAG: HAD family phosphatase [Dehalococcoidia bacterium]